MGEEVQVVLARLDGRIEALTQVVELRMRTQERDLESWRLHAVEETRKTKRQVEEVSRNVSELQEFKSKMVGIGVGLSLASGTVSGLVVVLLSHVG